MLHGFSTLFFYLLRLAQIISAHRRSATTIAYVGQLSHLLTAQVPFIGNERTAPIACLIMVARRHTEMTCFSHWFMAGGTYRLILFWHSIHLLFKKLTMNFSRNLTNKR